MADRLAKLFVEHLLLNEIPDYIKERFHQHDERVNRTRALYLLVKNNRPEGMRYVEAFAEAVRAGSDIHAASDIASKALNMTTEALKSAESAYTKAPQPV